MLQWAVDDGPVQIDEGPTAGFLKAVKQADELWAHNAEFDRTMLETESWWPKIPMEKWRCSAALARMHGLPGGLAHLCKIFKIPSDKAKDIRGKQLIQLFCVPNKDSEYNDKRSHPKEWAEFLAYGGQDVAAMREIWRKTPKWNATPRMWAMWHLDQRMNARGVAVDLALAKGAVEATTRAKKRMADRTSELTEGAVERTTQRDRLLAYMADFGVDLPDLTADTVERRLSDESLPEHIKELLRVRQQASKSSTAKYQRVINQCVDGRIRNLLVFCGASRTGRWAGRTIQLQNLPRPKHPQWEIDIAARMFATGAIELYDAADVLGLASSCLRGVVVSGASRRLVVSDLANIEGRFMAFVAGEVWKLKAFAEFDAKRGPDLYKVAYARAFNISIDTIADDDSRRQIGKVMELALQFYGGVGAFCSMAETYGLSLDALAESAWAVIPQSTKREAETSWHKAVKRKRTYGLAQRTWVVCQALVLLWRDAHPAIVKFWSELDEATKGATRQANKAFPVGKHIIVDRKGNWLRIRLPSGRYLCYPAPQGDDYTSSFLGVDPYTKQWGRISTYSGKRAENIVQAGSADILIDGLLAAEAAGFVPVLSVHDEIICDSPDEDKFNDKELSRLMVSSSPWAAGMPLAAKGKVMYRYQK
jgi:DNA polymerase